MKLISLNAWGGHVFDPLMMFVREMAADTDIFCFQEVWSSPIERISRGSHINLFEKLTATLTDHRPFFAPIQDGIDEEGIVDLPTTFGQVIFIRRTLSVEKEGFMFTYRNRNAMRNDNFEELGSGFQYIKFRDTKESFMVLSVHGISRPGDKLDTPARLEQVRSLRNFADNIAGKKVICGDFNLAPQTECVRILAEGMKNLIAEHHIETTRSRINFEKYPDDPAPQKFADYAFVSPKVNILSFQVPNVEISDHLPLILEFL